MADGTKLKPSVVFKRKTMPKNKFPPGLLVCCSCRVVRKVWFRRPGALMNKRSMFVWDMFRAHLTDQIKVRLKSANIIPAVLPGGCTSVLQPLDVCLNKPFKNKVPEQWNEWMVNGPR